MKFITQCPRCGSGLRFPLDRGKIRIKCRCGYEDIIDPDDTSLYGKGRFDLKPEESGDKAHSQIKENPFSRETIIRKLYDLSYAVQNFRYMPDREKYRLLATILLPVALIIIILYFLLT